MPLGSASFLPAALGSALFLPAVLGSLIFSPSRSRGAHALPLLFAACPLRVCGTRLALAPPTGFDSRTGAEKGPDPKKWTWARGFYGTPNGNRRAPRRRPPSLGRQRPRALAANASRLPGTRAPNGVRSPARGRKKPRYPQVSGLAISGTPNGNRTRVAALKGRCPGPLDDGGL